jgi:hypothetical protein
MRRRTLTWTFVLLALVAGGTFFRDRLVNEWKLWRLEQKFAGIAHPPGTEELSFRSKVGVFGNGNHCDFFAGQVRSFTGDWKRVEDFYAARSIAGASPEVRLLENDRDEIMCCYFTHLSDWGIAPKPGLHVYLVMLFRNEDANSDMRCH